MTENNKPRGQNMVEEPLPAGSAAILVYATYPSLAAAESSGRALVEARLAGCINIIPGMVSLYVWQDRLERSEEVVMIAKTMPDAASACMEAIRRSHPYETPAILELPVTGGSADYISWLREGTRRVRDAPA